MAPKNRRLSSKPNDPSRRSFIERVVGTGVTTPALISLTGSWLSAETNAIPSSSTSQTGSGSSTFSSKSGSSSSGSSSGGPYIAQVAGDSTLREDSPNTNEGANPRIRVSVRPVRRGIVQFNPQTVGAMMEAAGSGSTVYLTLHIAANNNSWSQDEDHYVDAHPLPPGYWVVEGNGRCSGMPPGQVVRGTGAGVTWNMPYDADTTDTKKKATKTMPANWNGANSVMLNPTAPPQLIYNGLSGQVSWDVTEDVRLGTNTWIIKVRDEYEPVHTAERRQQGFDPFRGSVDFYSLQGANEAAEIGCTFAPKLQVVAFNACPVPPPAEPPAEVPSEPPAEVPSEPPAEAPAPEVGPAEGTPAEQPPANPPANPPADAPANPPANPPSGA